MFELKVLTRFAAAHRLTMVAQQCENLHGHNWKVEVCVAGKTLDAGGVLMDFGIIKKHVRAVVERLDHTYLNELDFLGGKPPSSETIAVYIAEEVQKMFADVSHLWVSQVHVWESDDSCATYIVER
ncbi:MAG: 6-carboxytetrahydropterin synthase QueD [Proteobacteria bacterium]|nr:6-carboxytetrahydropterin synthase QueD [Pseudomonadota bacterium]